MRTKKIFTYVTLLVIAFSSFIACSDSDNYSLNNYRINIATVTPEGNQSYSLLLDNGTKLWPAAGNIYYKPRLNQRVFINYTILSDKMNGYDHYIRVNDMWDILTKPVIKLTAENADSIGHDPIRVENLWIANHYLNAEFSFNYGGVRPHAINLVQNFQQEHEVKDTLKLEFRHNSYNSYSDRLFRGLASFDLKPFRQEDKDSIPIQIKVKDWKGEQTYKLMYKYNGSNNVKSESSIPNITSSEYR